MADENFKVQREVIFAQRFGDLRPSDYVYAAVDERIPGKRSLGTIL
jgi:hypothetical protein